MGWMSKQVSLYNSHADNTGKPAAVGEVLFSAMGEYRKLRGEYVNDLEIIISLRKLNRSAPDFEAQKKLLKSKLQCYTPAGLLRTKAHGKLREQSRSGLLQLDFDHQDIVEYDLEDLKRCVFSLPFVAYCGLSCSGDGFYALACIAEPDRLAEYAEHLFLVLDSYGIKADQSKGKKIENLRYLSYDSKALVRDKPEILRISKFQTKAASKKDKPLYRPGTYSGSQEPLIRAELAKIKNAMVGHRWLTTQQVAFTLGGLGDNNLLGMIKNEIHGNPSFAGEVEKYCNCADKCFSDGTMKPLKVTNDFDL